MIYRIRVSAATGDKEAFRDIEIPAGATLEELHDVIWQSFGLDGRELATFYTTDEDLHLLEDIPLIPMEEGPQARSMENTLIDDVLNRDNPKLIYIYDLLNMWQFLIELLEEGPEIPGRSYPHLVYAHGQLPESPPDPGFETDKLDEWNDTDDLYGDFYDFEGDEWN